MTQAWSNPSKNPYDLVYPNLYVGEAPRDLPKGFDVVVFAATQFQPDFGDPPTTLLIYAPFEDGIPTRTELKLIQTTALRIAEFLRAKKRVLVACLAGLNRSGFLAVLAMMSLGVPKVEAIGRLRLARGEEALTNPHFLALLAVNS